MRRLFFVLLLLVLAIVVLMLATRTRQPEFKGRKVDAWFEAFFGTLQELKASEAAFRAMGTNALPYLRKQMHMSDSKLRNAEASLRSRLGRVNGIGMRSRVLRPLPREVRARALYLAAVAGGRTAIRDLISGLSDSEPDVRIAAATALRSFGTSAIVALPPLSALTNDGSVGKSTYAGITVKVRALEALRAVSGQSTNVYGLGW